MLRERINVETGQVVVESSALPSDQVEQLLVIPPKRNSLDGTHQRPLRLVRRMVSRYGLREGSVVGSALVSEWYGMIGSR